MYGLIVIIIIITVIQLCAVVRCCCVFKQIFFLAGGQKKKNFGGGGFPCFPPLFYNLKNGGTRDYLMDVLRALVCVACSIQEGGSHTDRLHPTILRVKAHALKHLLIIFFFLKK